MRVPPGDQASLSLISSLSCPCMLALLLHSNPLRASLQSSNLGPVRPRPIRRGKIRHPSLPHMFGESWSYFTHRSTCRRNVLACMAQSQAQVLLTSSTDAVMNLRASSPAHTLIIEKSPFRSIEILPPCVPSRRRIGSALKDSLAYPQSPYPEC